ncbi:hypothetical protein SUGI_0893680 [Cryptomeria japonica]|nr:hypothetical protein SUGI_0893680 [Cryptomeria japonica]
MGVDQPHHNMQGSSLGEAMEVANNKTQEPGWRMHTLFSVECHNYFDWQTVGLMHSYRKSGHPGPITRLLSCTDEKLQDYRGMDLAPTHKVPSMSRHPVTGDWYPAINKPAGVVHWLNHSEDAKNVDWVVILDADMIIRRPIIPWELGVEKGKPVAAHYGYLIGCDNILAQLHTKHPEYCDKVGGLLVFHIDDLRSLAPLWLSKTEEVRRDSAHWGTNITGDIFAKGWISEMYGYSFGAADVGLRHKIRDDLMLYPGYIPMERTEPILLHYGLRFTVGNWSFDKAQHHNEEIVYDCNRLFSLPPYPKEVQMMEPDLSRRRGLFLSIECINTINEGLLIHHESRGCPKPTRSRYLNFLKSKVFSLLTRPKTLKIDIKDTESATKEFSTQELGSVYYPKIHTIFSTECSPYFDWQTVGFIHSFNLSGQPGRVTRLLSCTEDKLKTYAGHDLAPTHYVPSMSHHPLTGDWYPAINKPAAVLHWLNHAIIDAEYIVILDADMIIRGPITPWEFGAERGHPVSAPYEYLIGCDNELAQIHTRHPEACDKVGGVIIMHVDDLRNFAPLWLHKTEEVRADREHWATNITGYIYGQGWISEMYGYAFGAAEINLRHRRRDDIMLYPGYIPLQGIEPRVLHYGLEFGVGNWKFDKADWREKDMTNVCWRQFPEPPNPSTLMSTDEGSLRRDKLSIECARTLNDALYLHHLRRNCLKTQSNENTLHAQSPPGISDQVERSKSSEYLKQNLLEKDASSDNGIQGNSELLKSTHRNSLSEKQMSLEEERGVSAKGGSHLLVRTGPRYWMVTLWFLSVLAFLVVVSTTYSRQKDEVLRKKNPRTKQ